MEISDEDYRKYLVWRLEQTYANSDSILDQVSEIKDTVFKQLDVDQLRLDTAIDQIEDLIKDKQFVYKEAVEFAVKKTLKHFPEYSGRNTEVIEVPDYGTFMVDLDTGEFLGGKRHLYDDWVTGVIKQPEPPKPKKLNLKRLSALAFPLILTAGFIVTTTITFVNRNFGALEITERRYSKP
jgi:hypothetical protein